MYASVAFEPAACDPQKKALIEEVLGRGHLRIFEQPEIVKELILIPHLTELSYLTLASKSCILPLL